MGEKHIGRRMRLESLATYDDYIRDLVVRKVEEIDTLLEHDAPEGQPKKEKPKREEQEAAKDDSECGEIANEHEEVKDEETLLRRKVAIIKRIPEEFRVYVGGAL